MTTDTTTQTQGTQGTQGATQAGAQGGQQDPSLTGSAGQATSTSLLNSAPGHQTAPTEIEIDKRLVTTDGKFNKDGYKEYLNELKAKDEKYEKRILDLRRTISKGGAPDKAEAYFEDYAPDERFMKFFEPTAENAKEMKEITDSMSKVYFDAGLNREQANKISNMFCTVMEGLGMFDTRSDAQKIEQKIKWIDEQKKMLGNDADNIIREARIFVEQAPLFSAKTKNTLNKLMDEIGAEFVDAVHQMKEAYGGGSMAQIPTSVSSLGSLPSDAELKEEYLRKDTTDRRREQIIAMRHRAGRTGKLMDA